MFEQESGEYRVEVRRDARDRVGAVDAELVVVWREGRADERLGDPGDHRHALRDVTIARLTEQRVSGQCSSMPALVASRWRSWATIILINAGKSTSGSHPSLVLALDGSPMSRSTSAGRRNLGS